MDVQYEPRGSNNQEQSTEETPGDCKESAEEKTERREDDRDHEVERDEDGERQDEEQCRGFQVDRRVDRDDESEEDERTAHHPARRAGHRVRVRWVTESASEREDAEE